MTDRFIYGSHNVASSEIFISNRAARTYDRHTLYLISGPGTEQQLTAFFDDLLKQVKKFVPDLDCRFRVNVILNKENRNTGITYVYLVDSRAYFMILGKNPDGTERVVYEETEQEKENEKAKANQETFTEEEFNAMTSEERTAHFNALFFFDKKDLEESWAEEEEETISPKIRKELGSAIRAMNVPYTASQKKQLEAINIVKGVDTPIPDGFGVVVQPSFVILDDDTDVLRHVLYISNVPEGVTESDLQDYFSIYNNNHLGSWIVKHKGSTFERPYPGVRISEREVVIKRNNEASNSSQYKPRVVHEKKIVRQAFIVFSSNTHDALFALQMTKKITLKGHPMYTCQCRENVFEFEENRIRQELLVKHEMERKERKRVGNPNHLPKAVENSDGFTPAKGAWGSGKLVIKDTPVEKQKATSKPTSRFTSNNMFSMLSSSENNEDDE